MYHSLGIGSDGACRATSVAAENTVKSGSTSKSKETVGNYSPRGSSTKWFEKSTKGLKTEA